MWGVLPIGAVLGGGLAQWLGMRPALLAAACGMALAPVLLAVPLRPAHGRIAGTSLLLSGVGGKVEPGETFRSAMLREYREETGTDLGPLVIPPPRWLTAEARGQLVPECAAALVVERPRAHPTGGALWIAVFLAVAVRTPQPVEKVELFVMVPAGTGAPDGANPPVNRLSLLIDGDLVPAHRALPAAVTEVTAEHTAAAVLGTQGLLTEWWLATA